MTTKKDTAYSTGFFRDESTFEPSLVMRICWTANKWDENKPASLFCSDETGDEYYIHIFTECCSSFVIFLAQVGHSCSDEWFVMQCEFDSPHTCMIYIKLAGSPWVCHTFLRFSRLLIIMCPSVFSPGMCHQNKEKSPISFCTCPHLYGSDCVSERFGICYCMHWRVAYIVIHWLLTQFDPGFTALIRSKVLILLF